MANKEKSLSRYDQRVKLVHDVLRENSKLDDKACTDLAERVLDRMDSMPEHVR